VSHISLYTSHCTRTQQLRGITGDAKALVFVNTKKTADILGRQLEQSGFASAVGVLHGGKSQEQRESALEDFRTGSINVLVATDVASRGLDIPDVGNVINYELPSKIETYCHRIGRTGRAGKDGIATSYITDKASHCHTITIFCTTIVCALGVLVFAVICGGAYSSVAYELNLCMQ
jgi:superfamily II DNA/RNA helicase